MLPVCRERNTQRSQAIWRGRSTRIKLACKGFQQKPRIAAIDSLLVPNRLTLRDHSILIIFIMARKGPPDMHASFYIFDFRKFVSYE